MSTPISLIAIGSSTGGTEALTAVLTKLKPPLPPIVIVQHIPPAFSRMLADRLNSECELIVKEGSSGESLLQNHAYIAPGGKHMTVKVIGGSIMQLDCAAGPPVHSVCPSVDVLFNSIAKNVKKHVLGIILTGMGKDGAAGLLRLKEQGAYTIGQDRATCAVYGMPKAAYDLGAVMKQLPLNSIAPAIMEIVKKYSL